MKKTRQELLSMSINDLVSYALALQDALDAPVANKKATSTPVDQEKSEPKTRAWSEREVVISATKKTVSYAYADGKYVGDKGVRMFINSKLKEHGATWDKEGKVWVLPTMKAAKALAGSITVSAADVDAYIQAKKATKAGK